MTASRTLGNRRCQIIVSNVVFASALPKIMAREAPILSRDDPMERAMNNAAARKPESNNITSNRRLITDVGTVVTESFQKFPDG
jgi:hypothetical protein